ncbi:enoyl-CoA hydratase-related protein [Falsigemmobacter faecalis]|uniref:Enoyl-CoA hydratase n=1 Tax=Falsigemmobacter faecalis TaxID=2488730 RepID=A0A3P3DVI7_9RHOB|nr:enoyl-CoA hydratase-related protein [Falsigemmobacter faecalis]RRH78185.1 enoyl-CoA hydratase [Falsigemmobacter faecalis]
MFEDISYDVQDRIALVMFNRPEVLNAARIRTHEELQAALDMADRDDGVRAVVVSGQGRAFCAGTDLTQGFNLPEGGNPASGEGVPPDIGGTTVLRLFDMRKPVAAAINGAAVGFGLTFTLAMDIRFAAETAKFALPFVRRGICAESCCSWFLPRLVGLQTAQDWMLSGRTFLAGEALARGLIYDITPPDRVLERALIWAGEIAGQTAPVSVALNRRLLWQMAGAAHPAEAHRFESRGLIACMSGPDAAEGVASFKERRDPQFTGGVRDMAFMDDWWPRRP